jgi:dTMP kinase
LTDYDTVISGGIFITFEGVDGSGKSTLINMVHGKLKEAGHRVIMTREPGGSPGAELIRSLLVEGSADRWDPMTEYLLLSAARRDHCVKTIKPALADGNIVLCDRFFDSSLAYQGYAYGLDLTKMRYIYDWLADGLVPHRTYVLDMDVESSVKRSLSRHNTEARYESLSLDFHEKVRKGFIELASSDTSRYLCLDAADESHSLIEKILRDMSSNFSMDI